MDFLTTINVGVEETENVLEGTLFLNVGRLHGEEGGRMDERRKVIIDEFNLPLYDEEVDAPVGSLSIGQFSPIMGPYQKLPYYNFVTQ